MTWDTVNVLIISWAGKIAWKLAGEILNVLEKYQVGKCWVHCPFPCNVLVMYRLGTPPLAPSVDQPTDEDVGYSLRLTHLQLGPQSLLHDR